MSDVHLGVISSNLGASGGDGCNFEHGDDRAWLLPLVRDELSEDASLSRGFIEWNAGGTTRDSVDALSEKVQTLVTAVGENGCGFEASLEAWYRFLVDPDPPERTVVQSGRLLFDGIDARLLEQRAAFLRPDSLVLIVGISDENECSIGDSTLAWQTAQAGDEQPFRMPRGTAACATEPDAPCCRPCASKESSPPAGCSAITRLVRHPERVLLEFGPQLNTIGRPQCGHPQPDDVCPRLGERSSAMNVRGAVHHQPLGQLAHRSEGHLGL